MTDDSSTTRVSFTKVCDVIHLAVYDNPFAVFSVVLLNLLPGEFRFICTTVIVFPTTFF